MLGFSSIFIPSSTRDKSALIFALLLSCLACAVVESLAYPEAGLLDRQRRAVVPLNATKVPENVTSNVTLFDLSTDAPNRIYTITNNSAGVQGMFQITNGKLTLAPNLASDKRKLFDYEKFSTFEVMLNATNQTDATDVKMLTIKIPLSDVNDETPVFTNKPKPFLATLSQDAAPSTLVYTVTVTDADSNPDLVFSIDQVTLLGQTVQNRFQSQPVDRNNPKEKVYNIITVGSSSFQQGANYTIMISALDRNTNVGPQLTKDSIIVQIGNRAPQFYEQSYRGRIYETKPATSTNMVLEPDSERTLAIQVLQFQKGAQLTYQLLDQDGQPSKQFEIRAEASSQSGAQTIVNKLPLDYEMTQSVSLSIRVAESGTGLASTVPIVINIMDENDNTPYFFAPQYSNTVGEDLQVGKSVLEVTASDLDSGPNGEIVFSVSNITYFDVTTRNNNKTYIGTVMVKSPLDYDSNQITLQFNVIARDKGSPPLSAQVPITVILQNVNDNPPTIVNTTTTISLNETSSPGSVVTLIQASDIDGDTVKFFFEGNTPTSDIFTIKETNGQVILNSAIPKTKDNYLLKVIAVDDDNCCASKKGKKTSTATFTVNIVDFNVNKPTFNNCLDYDTKTSVKEKASVGTPVIQVKAYDPDRGENGMVIYRIEAPDPNSEAGVFQIDSNTGNITVKGEIIRSQSGFVQVTVVGKNPPTPPLMEGRCTFRVNIIDINDNPPTFAQSQYGITVSIRSTPPTTITQMVATDKDVGSNANITYSLTSPTNDSVVLHTFSINENTGMIRLNATLEPSRTSYILIVVANDNGIDPGPLFGTATVTVSVNLENRKPPEWTSSTENLLFSVSESSPRDTVITTFSCKPGANETAVEFRVFDAGATIADESKYFKAISFNDSGVFLMNLSLRSELDYEFQKEYKVSVVCQSFGSVVLRAPLLTPVINVTDANDQVPEFVGLDSDGRYHGSVAENSQAGVTVVQVSAIDRDTTEAFRTVTFSLQGENKDYFEIKNVGPNRADIVTTSSLVSDREKIEHYTVAIVAQDGAPAFPPNVKDPSLPNIAPTRYIEIDVTDVNDNDPSFSKPLYTFNVSENAPITDIVGIVTANDVDQIDQAYGLEYRFTAGNINNAFNIFSVTGEIRVSKKLDYETDNKMYNLTLMALDYNQLHSATTLVQIQLIDENDNRPVFTKNPYIVRDAVVENDKSNTLQNPKFLVQVSATDGDVDRPRMMRYSLFGASQPGADQLFTVESISGNVSLIGSLDRDIPPFFYTITVQATDEPDNPLTSLADVLIYPLDVNDNRPEFKTQYLQGNVEEHSPDKYVLTVVAEDNDLGNNQTVRYRAAPNQPDPAMSSMFKVGELGDISTASNVTLLDREIHDQVLLVVEAYDLGTPPLENSATVTITLLDINDQSPYFDLPLYSMTISESQTSGQIMFKPPVTAIDKDSDPRNRDLAFTLDGDPNYTKFFRVQPAGSEAIISVVQPIDYETDPRILTFQLRVTDGKQEHVNTTTLQITVIDDNDNYPVFNQSVQRINRMEEEPPGQNLATFAATDADEGLNGEIVYSIDRKSDPRYEFYVHPKTGVVTNRKRLDREVQEFVTVFILAKDKGERPLTGTATLYVTLNDTNDNAPRFRENYRPVVPENVDNNNLKVLEIYATDPDTRQYGPPFTFSLPQSCSVPACNYFSLTVNLGADGGNNTATIITNTKFDREQMKYYYLPIVMSDMNGQSGSQTATNTLTITIGDENDNTLEPGNQDILVYNYEGNFSNVEIGRVYANDPDDWDLPDKTFTYLSPDNLKPYFGINVQTGMITLSPGLAPNDGKDPYKFNVNVYDRKFQKTVTCTVSVIIKLITDEAVRKSGGVRLEGITAEEFIKPVSSTSKYQQFREALAKELGYPSVNNVEIVSLTEGEGFLDVRYSAHASPYVNPSQGESAIMLNLAQFEQDVGVKVLHVPINLCMEETSDIGCYNKLDVTGKPELVNSNGTSYVLMITSLTAEEGCVDNMFPDPVECRGDYCFNGGTCVKDDWGKLSCACNPGFDGPRCQQLQHSFDGKSAAFYPGLSVCSGGRTSIEFITLQEDGLIMYSGPITAIDPAKDVHDYLILELKEGYPYLRLNLGGEEASLQLTGKDSSGVTRMGKLSDGKWHHLDIDRDNQMVTLTVDRCKDALTNSSTDGLVSDWSPCRKSDVVPGPDILLNVRSLLQLGGRFPNSSPPSYPTGVTTTGFSGCLRNLVHNTKLYDLNYKVIPSWKSGENGCPKEETICASSAEQPVCGKNAVCEASWSPDKVSFCRCKPGWYGDKCSKEAPTKDLQTRSYFAWNLNTTLIAESKRESSFQIMFRTRQSMGTLFSLTNADVKTILLQLVNGSLSLSYDMGQGTTTLQLDKAPANVGQWTRVRVERYGNEFLLSMDGGEGRNFNYQITNTDLGVFFDVQPQVVVGAALTSTDQVSNDLIRTCIRDVRFNDKWLPLTFDQNSDPYAGAKLTKANGIQDGCTREDCVGVPPCQQDQFCYPLWEKHECRCNGSSILINGACVATCFPNPCFNFGVCYIENNVAMCRCASGWSGPTCLAAEQATDDSGLGGGAIAGIVIAIIVLLILIILLLIFLLTRKRSEKEKIVEVDPDDDYIRENIVFYDEEGAGEEDHAAYDITLLQRPMKETNAKPMFNPMMEKDIKKQNAPFIDRRDVGPVSERPDVGSFIKDRINDAENEDPMTDSTREYNFEGGNSDAGSLSSLNTSSSGGSQDYDYLSEWGPKFAKLADMYGAGQNLEDV